VNDSVTYQQMDGMGVSLTESSAWLLFTKLTAAQRQAAMQQLFDPAAGIGISFLRQPMGASDFVLSRYTFDDVPAGESDPDLTNFSIDHDRTYIIPALQQALTINPKIKIMASPWSPPAWMKASDSLIGGSLLPTSYTPLANYFVRFVQAYQAEGIPIYAISIQNEPASPINDYPAMPMQDSEQASFLGQNLGPALAAAGISSKVMVFDNSMHSDFAITVLSDPRAGPAAAGTAMHCYAGDPSAGTTVHDAFPNKDVWLTECSRLTDPGTPSGFVLGQPNADVIVPMLRNYAKSFVLWNAVLDQNSGPHTGGCTTCLGLLKIDDSVSPATVSPVADYYLVGQFSKYTRPGAYQVRSDDGNTGGVLPVAFRNPDGSIVLVAYNNTADNVSFDVPWSGKSFNYTQPAGAVTTFVWSPATLPAVAISMAPSGLLLSPGATGNIALTFDPVNGANTQVALACSGAPIGAACSFTPSSLSISGSTQATASLKLTTTAPANRIATHSRSRGSVALLAGMALFVVGIFVAGKRMRSAALLMLVVMLGCGGGTSAPPLKSTTPTPAGTYTLTITATPSTGAATILTIPLKVE
jgi:glucosylceramidase